MPRPQKDKPMIDSKLLEAAARLGTSIDIHHDAIHDVTRVGLACGPELESKPCHPDAAPRVLEEMLREATGVEAEPTDWESAPKHKCPRCKTTLSLVGFQ